MTIGQLARRAGLAPSAIRYYEDAGLLPKAERISGRRVYDEGAIDRLLVIVFAKQAGFTLREIKKLIAGFAKDTPAGVRWQKLATMKLSELDVLTVRIDAMRKMLREALRCGCVQLESCGRVLRAAEGAVEGDRSG